ncbi:MAG: type II toxin-antitoxin system ParD family antitoxin [Rhizobiales bacterium]|nr:type II toxin-antitoxin system ParD family antitoxin [Hyphomicrobiales bacterium]OJU33151.1 MAG: hypothetical protein BGN94_03290 [Rhizobiales bacterium 68-8]
MNEIVKLKPELAAFVEEAVASGEYGSGEAVVEEALRDWKERRDNHGYTLAELRRLVQEGIDSGPSIDGDAAVAAIREKALARMKAR